MGIRIFSSESNDKLPAIDVIGEDEQQAVQIYMTLYNAYLLSMESEKDVLTNWTEGAWATTFVMVHTFTAHKDVVEYMKETHELTVEMEIT